MSPLDPKSVLQARPTALAERLGDEIAILDPDSGLYFGLNEVGARVWELLREPKSVQAITEELLKEYEVDRDRCQASVLNLAGSLLNAKLVEIIGEGTA